VFLTPDLKPLYGGTYFPPDNRYGRTSFTQVLHAIIGAWKNRRPAVGETANQLTDNIQRVMEVEPHAGDLNEHLLQGAATQLRRRFDARHGGFGDAPKFPHPMDLRLLLRVWKRFGDDDALQMVTRTLDGMAMGGMYDHLGGGFHGYSTDARWLARHFEKMLYDNALAATPPAYQATGHVFIARWSRRPWPTCSRNDQSQARFTARRTPTVKAGRQVFVWSAAEIEQSWVLTRRRPLPPFTT
jgi:uncharacterized protein YyaL (SSP411 family)